MVGCRRAAEGQRGRGAEGYRGIGRRAEGGHMRLRGHTHTPPHTHRRRRCRMVCRNHTGTYHALWREFHVPAQVGTTRTRVFVHVVVVMAVHAAGLHHVPTPRPPVASTAAVGIARPSLSPLRPPPAPYTHPCPPRDYTYYRRTHARGFRSSATSSVWGTQGAPCAWRGAPHLHRHTRRRRRPRSRPCLQGPG